MSTKEASRRSTRSPLHYEWARKVLARDGHKCRGCGMTQSQIEAAGGELWAAHIYPHEEYPELRYDVTNGRSSCTFLNRGHPQGRGYGFGCHNAQSGHWGKGGNNMPGVHTRCARSRPCGFWHKLSVLVLSIPLWWAVVLADVDLRYYWAWSRHFTFGQATTIGGMFALLLILVALWGACLIVCHLALRHRWLGRAGRGILHALVRLARWAKP
jgi:hypothetical protein